MFKVPEAGMVCFSDPSDDWANNLYYSLLRKEEKTCDEASNVLKSVEFQAIFIYIRVRLKVQYLQYISTLLMKTIREGLNY